VNSRFSSLSIILLAALAAAPSWAGQVTVSDAWFRALPGTLPSGGYFTLHNTGASAVQFTRAETPACGMVMLHQSMEMNGISKMADVTNVPVPAGGSVSFAPGGYHLMCMGPTAAMKPGGHVPVTLDFADGSKVAIDFAVRNAAGK
jgi:periplasmic copper chaperone A